MADRASGRLLTLIYLLPQYIGVEIMCILHVFILGMLCIYIVIISTVLMDLLFKAINYWANSLG